jgi:hypothetical protein
MTMNNPEVAEARKLLVATSLLYHEHHPNAAPLPLRPGTPVEPQYACERIGWARASSRCAAALRYLEAEQALERSTTTRNGEAGTQYVWGRGAADMLGGT